MVSLCNSLLMAVLYGRGTLVQDISPADVEGKVHSLVYLVNKLAMGWHSVLYY